MRRQTTPGSINPSQSGGSGSDTFAFHSNEGNEINSLPLPALGDLTTDDPILMELANAPDYDYEKYRITLGLLMSFINARFIQSHRLILASQTTVDVTNTTTPTSLTGTSVGSEQIPNFIVPGTLVILRSGGTYITGTTPCEFELSLDLSTQSLFTYDAIVPGPSAEGVWETEVRLHFRDIGVSGNVFIRGTITVDGVTSQLGTDPAPYPANTTSNTVLDLLVTESVADSDNHFYSQFLTVELLQPQ